MRKFTHFLKENSSAQDWMSKVESSYDIAQVARDCVTASLDSMMFEQDLTLRDFEDFSSKLIGGLKMDETDILHFDLEKELDLCIYAEEVDQEECPQTSFELLQMVITRRAVDGLRYIAEKYANKFLSRFETLTDAYDLHDFRLAQKDPFSNYPPKSVEDKPHFSVYNYRGLDNDAQSNYDVYHFSEKGYPEFYLVSKV